MIPQNPSLARGRVSSMPFGHQTWSAQTTSRQPD
jgi:hypothetical protein